MKSKKYRYDVCLSFAGEDRSPVKRLATLLTQRGVRVFYDEYAKAELWGKDLYAHLDDIYQNAAQYCVVFLSKNYAKKLWTNHERKSAQARALRVHSEYVLPVRIDNTKIEGVRETVGYVNLSDTTISELADLVGAKVEPRQRKNYFPPYPDRLLTRLKIKKSTEKDLIYTVAHSFYETLGRMNATERKIIFESFLHGCPTELPDNIHISLDFLRRILKMNPTKIVRIASNLQSLGFDVSCRGGHGDDDNDPVLVIEWHDRAVDWAGNYTFVVNEIINTAAEGRCTSCASSALRNLDFAQLASATKSIEPH